MKKTHIYILFGLMVIAQIFASAQIVYKYESIISPENVYKFKTAPIDPNNPFMGKYVDLNFEMNFFVTEDTDWHYGQTAYAYISKDENGYAVLETLSKEILPNSEFDYVAVETSRHYHEGVRFQFPFNTYYMKETKAYDAELLYRRNNRTENQQDVYAIVHIKNGNHVLTDVIIDGVSLKDAVED
ncbi:GDYXXLXY domain-containing protein [uncultured Kordia sp.]|uniref:GDYXXLXY domain-containing protein n=1 Tax=uncultured Kordia sp. TaxID=507699 RepID=UPI002621F685|nr:GDYXXLXY domain-containing protein [uncultured Kordia sp.]